MMNEMNEKENRKNDVIFSVLRLSRAMRRCVPDQSELPFPPAVGRLLACVRQNSGVSSRELCELMDLRPSSLSEMLSRAEEEGWLTRKADQGDKRLLSIRLTEKGEAIIARIEQDRKADAEKKTACFSEAEKEQFCLLCNRLSEHLESLAPAGAECEGRMPPHGFSHGGPHRDGPGKPHGDRPKGFFGKPHGEFGKPGDHRPEGPFGKPNDERPNDPFGKPDDERPEGRPPFPPGARFRS